MHLFCLPNETLCEVADHLAMLPNLQSLVAFCSTHSLLRAVGQRALFRIVRVHAVQICAISAAYPRLAQMIRTFRLDLDKRQCDSLVLSSVALGLGQMNNLRELQLCVGGTCGKVLLGDVAVQLRSFECDAVIDAAVLEFIATQHRLHRLSLSYADAEISAPSLRVTATSALARLTSLRCSWTLAADILPGRAVEELQVMGMVDEEMLTSIMPHLLGLENRLRKLSLNSGDRPSDLLPVLATGVPYVEELRLSLCGSTPHDESIQFLHSSRVMHALRLFRKMTCLRVEAFLTAPDTEVSRQAAVAAMGSACPTLERVELGFFPRVYLVQKLRVGVEALRTQFRLARHRYYFGV